MDKLSSREKRIQKIAASWVRRNGRTIGSYSSYATTESFARAEAYKYCGRLLLKILGA